MENFLYIVFIIFGLSLMGVGIMQTINNSYPKGYEKKYKIKSVVNIVIGIFVLIFGEIIFEFKK